MKSDRHKTVDVDCVWCGVVFSARVERVEAGLSRFCSMNHYREWKAQNKFSNKEGKENAIAYHKQDGGYFVQWTENGKPTNKPWHNWAWEMNFGEIPHGYKVEYKDGNKDNIVLENLQLRLTRRCKQALPKTPKIKLEKTKIPYKPKRIEFTQEMINDLSKIGDKYFSQKWEVSLPVIRRIRNEQGIKPFNNQHGTKPHKFIDDIEYKWCPMEGGHWSPLDNFGIAKTRFDSYRGLCKFHSIKVQRKSYVEANGKEQARVWRKTESGKASLRNTWRKEKAKKDNAYVLWEREHEENAYNIFDGSCAYCGIKVPFLKIEFDHFVPITKNGKTEPGNMLPCCTRCNHGIGGKFKKDAWEWLSEKFGLERAGYIWNVCTEKLAYLSNQAQY